jgi:hypothetical protein
VRESKIEEYLVLRVKSMGGEVRKVKWIGHRGAPDRLVMLPPWEPSPGNQYDKTVWVELKATGEKPEPHQLREHKRMRKMGQRVEIVDSLAGVDALLEI